MLKEPPDNCADRDILARAGKARPQAADAPDLEIYLYPGLRCAVQGTDTFWIDERVHLEDEMAAPVLLVARDLPVDLCEMMVVRRVTGATASFRYWSNRA